MSECSIAPNVVIYTPFVRFFMRQYTETYRVPLSTETKAKLDILKPKYHIKPTSFIRIAIEEKFRRDLPMLKIKSENKEDTMPF